MKNKVLVSNMKHLRNLINIDELPEDAEIIRKQYLSEIAVDEADEMTVVGKISTIDEDRDGDIVMPGGMSMARFSKNPVVMCQHDYSELPVGKAIKISVTEDAILSKTKFASTTKGKEVYQLFKEGILRAFSIGFVINKALIRGTDAFKQFVAERKLVIGEGVRRIITQAELLEYSCVNIPANPSALVMQVSEKQAVPEVVVDLNDIHAIPHTALDFGEKAEVPAVVPAVDPAPVQPTPAVQPTPEPTPVWNVVRSGSAVSTMTDAQARDIARQKKSGRVV